MKTLILIFPALMFVVNTTAQQDQQQFIKKHLVRADGSIVPGYIFKDNINNVHLNGNLEYYLDNSLSIRGDANYMLGSSGQSANFMRLKDNVSVMLGCSFHIPTNNHFDPYIILQPGIAYVRSYRAAGPLNENLFSEQDIYYKGSLSPLASAGIGFNYYFQRFAHLFCETRYVHGKHLSDAPSPVSLEELRITFGLGFNVCIIKDKKRPA